MKIEHFFNMQIAYMRTIGNKGNKELMETFKTYVSEKKLLDDTSIIVGIPLDNPNFVPPSQLRYDVGLLLTKSITHCDLDTRYIDQGMYAIFEVDHKEEAIINFWKSVPTLAIDIDTSKPIIERYAIDKIKKHRCEFCIPLKQ